MDARLSFRCSVELEEKMKSLAKADRRKLSDWLRIELERLVQRKRPTMVDKCKGRA